MISPRRVAQLQSKRLFSVNVTGLPFDDIRQLIKGLPELDQIATGLARERGERLEKTFGIPAQHTKVCEWLAASSGTSPAVSRPVLCLFAGTHAVAAELGQTTGARVEATLDTVTRMAAGAAPVNQACASADAGLKVFDLALQYPVADIRSAPALTEKDCAATIGFGMEAVSGGVDLLGLCAFGTGSEVGTVAICSLLFDKPLALLGQDLPSESLQAAQEAVQLHRAFAGNPLELLRRLGGREHAALAGAILAARSQHIPVLLDGAVALAVVGILENERPGLCDHCRFAGKPAIEWQIEIFEELRIPAIGLDHGLSSDGTSAALAVPLAKAIAAVHSATVPDPT